MKNSPEKITYSHVNSPVGQLLLVANSEHLITLAFVGGKGCPVVEPSWTNNPAHPVLQKTEDQLLGFFNRKRSHFSLPILAEGTVFQRKVWQEMTNIPYAKTISYSELAERIGSPKASRAVGLAAGQNPHCIVVPCHRVVGKNGSLTGFAGGLNRKQTLLDHEKNEASLLPNSVNNMGAR